MASRCMSGALNNPGNVDGDSMDAKLMVQRTYSG